MIRAVGVVVPARNEASQVGACLHGIERALQSLPAGVDTAVWVVADRCTDGTAEIVDRVLAGRPGRGWEPSSEPLPVGSVRARGVRAVLRMLRRHEPSRVWLLNTDADTVAPADWALAHLRHADGGADVVAGVADLAGDCRLHPEAVARYAELISRQRCGAGPGTPADGHAHVYGANLGVRADRYLQVGGFAPRSCGEDADLVVRLRRAGAAVGSPLDVRVVTSARTDGRAAGGLADLLGSLQRAATGPGGSETGTSSVSAA